MNAAHPDITVRWLLLHIEKPEDRRLAGSAGTDEKNKFATLHLEGDVTQGYTALRVLLCNIV
jgi:hypothetical protein